MPIDKRDETDGITTRRVRVMPITGPRTAEEQAILAAHHARLGFEASIPAIEKVALDARTRDFHRISTYASHGWYAQRALSLITRVRQARDEGRIDEALWAAVLLGHTLTESGAKGWRDLQVGLTHRAHQAKRAVQGVRAKRENRAPADKKLREAVRAYRIAHPTAGVRTIARALVPTYGPTSTTQAERQKAIDALRQRIARLEKR